MALAESLSDTLASLQSARSGLSDAWALRMSASQKAHFAARLIPPGYRKYRRSARVPHATLQRDARQIFTAISIAAKLFLVHERSYADTS